jgi:hypothetical protein
MTVLAPLQTTPQGKGSMMIDVSVPSRDLRMYDGAIRDHLR